MRFEMRQKLLRVGVLMAVVCGNAAWSPAATLVPQAVAGRFGLVRAWSTQIPSRRSLAAIAHMNLDEGMLLVQTRGAMLTALDAQTGRAHWSTQTGPSQHLCTEPAANEKFVVVVNGSVLYVLDKHDGRIVWHRELGGVPGSGPGVSQTHAFVPMVSGLIEGYNLEKGAGQQPWVYKSFGRVLIPPMTTTQSVSWTTEKGYFYVADPSGRGIRYRLETRTAIQSRPGYWTPNLYACSTDGYVYAIDESNGRIKWRFSAGDAIYSSPIAIQSKVYVVSEINGLYCLDGDTGGRLWHAPNIAQFVSASPTRIYGIDRIGRLAILDLRTGTSAGAMALEDVSQVLVNAQSDRVYLASDSGLVQCLRQADLRSPVYHVPPPAPEPESPTKEKRTPTKAPAADSPAEESADEPAKKDAEPSEPVDENAADLFGNP